MRIVEAFVHACQVFRIHLRFERLHIKEIPRSYFHKSIFDFMTYALVCACCQEMELLVELFIELLTRIFAKDTLKWLE